MSMRLSTTIVAAVATLACMGAQAAAPMVKTQGPGYYRIQLGDFEVTALNDGTVDLAVDKILHQPAAKTKLALNKSFLNVPLETSVNGYLVNTGSKLVLIDTGASNLFGPTLGKLADNLKAAGYQPEQVDEIYITHLHGDHVGGVARDGKVLFPNAVLRADKHDTDFWLSKVNMEKAPADMKGFFQGAMASVAPYSEAGKLNPFDGDTELVPGVKAVTSYGHTPGHIKYVIESKGQKLVLLGDLLHVQAVQFDDPSVTIAFDTDSKKALLQRKAAFAEAAKQGYLVGAAHLQFPGIGHVRAQGKNAYQFVPVNYTVPR